MDILNKRGLLVLPGNQEETVEFATIHFLETGKKAISANGFFYVALSGGQTPHAIFEKLSSSKYKHALDWSKVICFWSDERSVPPNDPESNYFNAMQSGLGQLPLKKEHLFRMQAESQIAQHAQEYDLLIQEKIPGGKFDLIMLGMGDDGHTASLFPHTKALATDDCNVAANFVPQKDTWRMTFTYPCINQAKAICIYILGAKKADVLNSIFNGPYQPDVFPIQKIGTIQNPAHWILDDAAALKVNKIS